MSGYPSNRDHSRARAQPTAVLGATLFALCGVAVAQQPETSAAAAIGATATASADATTSADTPKQKKKKPAALAQASVPATAQSTAAATPAQTPASASGTERPTSTEQGQSPLDESFAPRTHQEWVEETRRKAWQDTKWDVQLRTYYLDRDKYDDTQSEAWAIGGSVGVKTGYFREIMSLGATAYTSIRLHGPEDKDGTLLLKPGQHSYAVLGEMYGEFLLTPDTRLTAGWRGIDTPYINRNDSRMTPNTFELLVVQGLYGGKDGAPEWRVGGGYINKIKERNDDEWVPMSEDAGAPEGFERGVWAGGANYKTGNFSIGAINYYSDDIINIFYTEAKYGLPLSEDLKLQFALQYSDQQSVGDNLIAADDFSARQWGGKAELAWGGALFTTAYTSATGDANMRNPWSGYPGYTSVQVEDFNRDGEDAWLLRASYAFESVKGLSLYGLYVDGSDPEDPAQFAKDETNLNLQWVPAEGTLAGLMMRLRYSHVEQDDPAGTELNDLRVMIYYDPPSL